MCVEKGVRRDRGIPSCWKAGRQCLALCFWGQSQLEHVRTGARTEAVGTVLLVLVEAEQSEAELGHAGMCEESNGLGGAAHV